MSSDTELDRWRRAERLFEAALDRPATERDAFLRHACGADEPLRRSIDALLARDDDGDSFLDQPVVVPEVEADSVDASHPWTGRVLGAYRLLRPIGAGGMSLVFSAEPVDDEIDRTVAIKVLRDGARSAAELRSIRRERQILASWDHPHIARALDGGTTEEGLPYMVLDVIEGEPITVASDATRSTVEQRLELFAKVCQAMDFAHRRLVIHRDLKPSNILVTDDGEPKVLDFGIAKILHDPWSTGGEATRTAAGFLTPLYASPEQLAGEPVSMASDIYSLGVVLHELLTGLRPRPRSGGDGEHGSDAFERPSRTVRAGTSTTSTAAASAESAKARARDRGTTPDRLRRQLTGDLDSIVLHCLHADPEQRYRSVAELERDIHRHLTGLPVLARPPKWSYRAGKFIRRYRWAVASACLSVVILVASGIGLALQNRQVIRQRDRAEAAQHESDAVTDFLTESFLLADPHHGVLLAGSPDEITAFEVLDHGARRIHDEMADQPALKARLMHTIGTIFSRLSRDDEAERLLLEALATRRAAGSPDDLAATLDGLIFLYVNSGRLTDAEPLVDEALELTREEALEPLLVAEILSNSGMYSFYLGEAELAESRFRQALAIQERLLPPDHRDTTLSRSQLGALLSRLGELAEAEALLRQAIDSTIATVGDDHVRVASVASELAWLLTTRGEHDEAETWFRRSLDIFRRWLGPEHRSTIEAEGALGLFLRESGDFAAAEAIMLENLASRRRAQPDDVAGEVVLLNNLAMVAGDRLDHVAAERYLREALALGTRGLGETFRDRHTLLRNLGLAVLRQGRPREAEPLLRQAVELMAVEPGPQSPSYANGLTSLARVHNALGDFEAALRWGDQAATILSAALPPEHPRIARARGAAGEALVGLGRFDEAEPILLDSFERLADASPPLREMARDRLCDLYRDWERRDQADRYCDPPVVDRS